LKYDRYAQQVVKTKTGVTSTITDGQKPWSLSKARYPFYFLIETSFIGISLLYQVHALQQRTI
jgi:hypothetical protein